MNTDTDQATNPRKNRSNRPRSIRTSEGAFIERHDTPASLVTHHDRPQRFLSVAELMADMPTTEIVVPVSKSTPIPPKQEVMDAMPPGPPEPIKAKISVPETPAVEHVMPTTTIPVPKAPSKLLTEMRATQDAHIQRLNEAPVTPRPRQSPRHSDWKIML